MEWRKGEVSVGVLQLLVVEEEFKARVTLLGGGGGCVSTCQAMLLLVGNAGREFGLGVRSML